MFNDENITKIMALALSDREKIGVTNKEAAAELGVDEKTIRNWRKEHPRFNQVFICVETSLAKKMNHRAISNLDPYDEIYTDKDGAVSKKNGKS